MTTTRNKAILVCVALALGALLAPASAWAATFTARKASGGMPVESGTAYLFSAAGSYLGVSDPLDAQGQFDFGVSAGTQYKIRIDRLGVQFWSPVFDGDSPPAEIVFAHSDRSVTVSTDFGGTLSPLGGVKVYVFGGASGTSYVSFNQATSGSGQVSFNLPDEFVYRYRADYRSTQTFSALTTDLSETVDISVADVRVRFENGAATPSGVKIYAFTSGGTYLSLSATTDSSGEVLFTDFPSSASYKFRADFQTSQYWSEVLATPASGSEPLVTIAVPSETIAFTVADAPGGAPLSFGTVYLFSGAGAYLNQSRVVGAGGAVSFESLPQGTYQFRYDALTTQTFSAAVSVPGSSTFTEFVIPFSTRTVSVQKDDGTLAQPLQGVPVYAYSASGSYLSLTGLTDSAGEQSFYLPDSLSAQYRVDYLQSQTWSDPGFETTVSLPVPVGVIEVTWQTTESIPIAGAPVYAFTEAGSYLGLQDTTDSGGSVSFELVVGETYKFRLDYLASQYWSPVASPASSISVDVSVDLPGETLSFVMREAPGGAPLTFGTVFLFTSSGVYLNQSIQPDSGGNVSFADLTAGSYQLRFDHQSLQTFSSIIGVPGSATFTEFVVPYSLRTVSVQTEDSAQIEPLPARPVYVFKDSTYLSLGATTDAAGQAVFYLNGALNARYRVDFKGAQYFSAPGTGLDPVVSVPVGRARLEFEVGGDPVAGASAYLFTAAGSYLSIVQPTGAAGESVFAKLVDGQGYKIRVDYKGSQYWTNDFIAQTGAELLVALDIPGEDVSFVMRAAPGGTPLEIGTVYLFTAAGTYLNESKAVQASGAVLFEGLPQGSYRFRYDALMTQTFSDVVNVPGSGSFTEFIVSHTERTVSVRTDFGGQYDPLVGVPVYAFNAADTYLSLTQTTDGSGEV